MKVVPGTRDTSKLSSSSAELACSPRLRLASLATERLAARRTIAGVVSVSIVFGPGAGVPTLSSLTTHTRAVGSYIGSRRNIARLRRLTLMAAIMAMSSAPPTVLATIAASTLRTLLPFPSSPLTLHDSGGVNALVQLHERFWAISCSVAYALAERRCRGLPSMLVKLLYSLPRRSPDRALGDLWICEEG